MNKNIIVFPTDTVYGIGVKLYDFEGLKLIHQIKERPMDKLISVLASNITQIEEFAILDERSIKIIDYFMPGPLTVIVKSRENYYNIYNEETVGVRIPNYQLAIDILNEYGPLKTTSVNIHNTEPLNDFKEIRNFLKNNKYYKQIKIYEDDNKNSKSNLASTVIDLTSDEIKVVRQGAINLQEIYNLLK